MKVKNSIRLKLRLSFILIVVITGSLAILLGYKLIFDRVIQEARDAGRRSILLLVRRAGEPRFVALNVEQ